MRYNRHRYSFRDGIKRLALVRKGIIMRDYKNLGCISLFIIMVVICVSCSKEQVVISNREPFTGDFGKYVYTMEEGRNREWEEDIISFARKLLDSDYGHPNLRDYPFNMYIEDAYMVRSDKYKLGKFYNPTLKEEVIHKIDALLAHIPQLEDYEILYGMQEILAMFNDIHSYVAMANSELYPFETIPIYDEERQFYVTRAPKGQEVLLYSKLEKINGIPIKEVVEKFKRIISYESEYSFILYVNMNLFNEDALKYIGVAKEGKVKFTFIDKNGKRKTVSQKAINKEELEQMEMIYHEAGDQVSLKDSHDVEEYYWYEYLEDKDTIYMRYSQCTIRSDLNFNDMLKEMIKTIEEKKGVSKYIIDLRGNPGGWVIDGFPDFVRWLNKHPDFIGKKYILIDENTASGAIMSATLLKKNVENIIMVGNGGSQGPNFFFGGRFVLENCDTKVLISSTRASMWPEYEEETLMPDILITPTIEDYINNIDPVLNAVLNN